ncbi:phenylalanine--tRNA ligase beta subunit-related protein [Nannocystaceae bacterium ST9]
MATSIEIAEHPLLLLGGFEAVFPAPLAELTSPAELRALLSLAAASPLPPTDEAMRKQVRELLRHGGFKPSGRSKPASEFLLRAASQGELGSINLAVDLCNVASLHSGLPISVVDRDRVESPLKVAIAEPGSSYVFNASGQTIALDGLLCLHDAAGPCANPVKDSQRSKTHAGTIATICVVWGCRALAERSAATTNWYRALHERFGAQVRDIAG